MYSPDSYNGRSLKRKAEGQESHKQIEKRRRDRINQSLLELSQAIPAAFSKQGSRRLEKAEILEMTVQYIRAIENTEIAIRLDNGDWYSSDIWGDFLQHYQSGYSDCMRELYEYYRTVHDGPPCGTDDHLSRALSYLQSRYRPETALNAAFQRGDGEKNPDLLTDSRRHGAPDRLTDTRRQGAPDRITDSRQHRTTDLLTDSRRHAAPGDPPSYDEVQVTGQPRMISALTRRIDETNTTLRLHKPNIPSNAPIRSQDVIQTNTQYQIPEIVNPAPLRSVLEPTANSATPRIPGVPPIRRCFTDESWPLAAPRPELQYNFRY